MENSLEKSISTAVEWKNKRKKAIKTITLPSGISIKVHAVDLLDCISAGYLPLEVFRKISTTAVSLVEKQESGQDAKTIMNDVSTEDFTNMHDMLCKIAVLAVEEPTVVPTRELETEDNVCVLDIGEADLLAIFSEVVVMEGDKAVAAMKPFPKKRHVYKGA